MPPIFSGLVLAAGESSRMKSDKALLPWPPADCSATPAETFLGGIIRTLRAHTQHVYVVAGRNADRLAPVVYARGASLVVNPHPERGQFSSLRAGLQELLNQGRDAAIIALVDRPPAASATVNQLRDAFAELYPQGKWAVVPAFEGRHGHPILVGREMIEAFLRAPETSNAREVEHALQDHVAYVDVTDPLVVMNVNTPEDYDRLRTDAFKPACP